MENGDGFSFLLAKFPRQLPKMFPFQCKFDLDCKQAYAPLCLACINQSIVYLILISCAGAHTTRDIITYQFVMTTRKNMKKENVKVNRRNSNIYGIGLGQPRKSKK